MSFRLFGFSRVGWSFVLLVLIASGSSAQQTTTLAPIPTQLTLDLATGILLSRNPAILRERQNVVIARAGVAGARLLPNPAFDLASESYPLFQANSGPFFQNDEMLIRIGQTLETAGKRGKRTQVAEQDVAVAQSLLQDTMRQVKLELRTRYFRVVLAKAQNELAREVLSQFDEIIRLNETRFQRGEVSGLDLARVQTERLRFFNDQVSADVELQNSKTGLLELLGATDMGAPIELTESLAFHSSSFSLEELEQEALVARADLRARTEQVVREQRDLTLEKANSVPDVTPFLGYKRNFRDNTVAFGLNVSLPIFNRNQGGIARATARIEQAGFERQQAELAVKSQVRQAYEVVQGEERRVRELESTYVPKARQARDIAQAAYRLGSLNLIGFLDAERAYRETLRGYNQALFDHRVAVFLLEAAVGKEQ
jgi:cobalt-zinc-cadmium efflux system outer membrane protein